MKTIKLLHDIGSKKVKYLFTAKVLRWDNISIFASTKQEVENILENSTEYIQFKSINRNVKRY
jgi:hypothetical protein